MPRPTNKKARAKIFGAYLGSSICLAACLVASSSCGGGGGGGATTGGGTPILGAVQLYSEYNVAAPVIPSGQALAVPMAINNEGDYAGICTSGLNQTNNPSDLSIFIDFRSDVSTYAIPSMTFGALGVITLPRVMGINSHGTAIAVTWDSSGSYGYLASPGTGLQQLSFLPEAINDAGSIVGNTHPPFPQVAVAMLRKAGADQALSPLAGNDHARVLDINNSGDMVGTSWHEASGTVVTTPTIWDQDGSPTALALPSGLNSPFPCQINDKGSILFQSAEPSSSNKLAMVVGGTTKLIILPFGTDKKVYVAHLTSNDEVFGYSGDVFGGMKGASWLYSDGTVYLLKQLIPQNATESLDVAYGVNDSRYVVGMSFGSNFVGPGVLLMDRN